MFLGQNMAPLPMGCVAWVYHTFWVGVVPVPWGVIGPGLRRRLVLLLWKVKPLWGRCGKKCPSAGLTDVLWVSLMGWPGTPGWGDVASQG